MERLTSGWSRRTNRAARTSKTERISTKLFGKGQDGNEIREGTVDGNEALFESSVETSLTKKTRVATKTTQHGLVYDVSETVGGVKISLRSAASSARLRRQASLIQPRQAS
jgi:hypothetical protein